MKKNSRILALAVLALPTVLAVSACKKKDKAGDAAAKPTEVSGAGGSAAPGSAAPAPATPPVADAKNLLETAKAAGKFNTLVKAVDAAGLGERLAGAGSFTVFAPTDEAFAKLPPADLDALLADKPKLEALLQYHIGVEAVSSKDLAGKKTVKSVQGAELAIDASSGIKIAGATVVTPDVLASNGVIHAIDTVLALPN